MVKRRFEIFPSKYGFFPYIFLIYLFLPAYYLYFESGWKFYTGYVLLFLFMISYRQLYFATKSFTKWLIFQVAIILFLSASININIIFLGYFSAHFIGWFENKKKFSLALFFFGIAILIPFMIHFEKLFPEGLLFFTPFVFIMLISPFGIRSMNSRMELERKLNEANEKIEELVKREERIRIARDLHDTLGHTLSLITLKSQLVGKLIKKDIERAELEVKEIERTSRTALSQVRELVSEMRAITIAEELLSTASILKAAGISLHYDHDLLLEDIPGLTQNILSMCIREAVTNVVKHSQAKNCHIGLTENAGEINISIYDDGRGIVNSNNVGNGLKGMMERLELIDGSMQITAEEGTKLIITVPVIIKEREAGVVS